VSPGSSGVKGNNPLVRSLSAASDLRYLKQWFWDSLLQGFLMRPNSKRRSDHESTRGPIVAIKSRIPKRELSLRELSRLNRTLRLEIPTKYQVMITSFTNPSSTQNVAFTARTKRRSATRNIDPDTGPNDHLTSGSRGHRRHHIGRCFPSAVLRLPIPASDPKAIPEQGLSWKRSRHGDDVKGTPITFLPACAIPGVGSASSFRVGCP